MFPPLLRWLIPVLITLSPAATASEPAPPEQTPEHQPRVFRFNVSATGYPPYLIHNEDGTYSGIALDVVSRITERLGYELSLFLIPRKRVESMLLAGHIDDTPRAQEWTPDPERFLFTDPMVPIREVFFAPADSEFRFTGLDELKGITVVTPLGYHYPLLQPLFDSNAIERYDVADDKDIFTYLLHGRGLDVTVADQAVGQWIIRQRDWQGQFRHSTEAISDYGYRLMLRPDWTDFAEAFNEELANMKARGELEEILSQYR